MSAPEALPRNPGPSWGFHFLQAVQRMPRPVLHPLLSLGTWVAVALMPTERRHSRHFLSHVLGRPAGWRDVWRHFFSYLDFLLLRLRVAGGAPPVARLDPENAGDFEALMQSREPALFGTFHFGHSDLLGFLLASRGRQVAMIRLRMANSADTRMLEEQFGGAVSFIWVNEPGNLLFAVKSAIERGESLALQCDRLYAARAEPFRFLGAPRLFPFTIYHLAFLFQRPVMFCLGLPESDGATRVCPFPLFRPDGALAREENLRRARVHFQAVLARLDTLVRQHPTLWFNFLPLNPEAAAVASPESMPAKSSPPA
jgi:predicted LPLAT superfamily acyltransferase